MRFSRELSRILKVIMVDQYPAAGASRSEWVVFKFIHSIISIIDIDTFKSIYTFSQSLVIPSLQTSRQF